MEELTKKEVVAFVSKLNDRNLQRKRESGFTVYALIAVLGYCLFFMTDNFNDLFLANDWKNAVRLIAVTLNCIMIAFFYYYAVVIFFQLKPEVKVYSIFQEKYEFLSIFSLGIILVVCFAFNFIAAYSYEGLSGSGYFLLVSIILALNLTTPFIYKFVINRIRKKKLKNLKITLFRQKQRESIGVSLLFYGTVFLLFTIVHLSTFPLELSPVFALAMKYGIITFVLSAIVMILLEKIEESSKYDWLENLENQIYFDDLSKEEIIEKLQKEVYGINLSKWAKERSDEIDNFINKSIVELESYKDEIIEIGKISSDFQHEIKGRKKALEENFTITVEEIKKFQNELSSQLNHLAKFGSTNENDIKIINYISNYYNAEIIKVGKVGMKLNEENKKLPATKVMRL